MFASLHYVILQLNELIPRAALFPQKFFYVTLTKFTYPNKHGAFCVFNFIILLHTALRPTNKQASLSISVSLAPTRPTPSSNTAGEHHTLLTPAHIPHQAVSFLQV